jgi:YD repeat-containing protein
MTNDKTEVFTYDNRGRKETYTPPATLSDDNPGAHPTRYFYYDSGPNTDRLWYVVDPFLHATWYEYNNRGQVTKLTHQDGTFTQSKYNDDGTLAWTADENHPDAGTEGHEYERTSYEYDEYRRVTKVINPLLKETRTDYIPPNGRPFSHTTSSVYHVTTQMGKVTEYDYDANFRRKRMTVAPSTGDAATTTYVYDEVGNLSRVRAPKQQPSGPETLYGYDDRNRRTSVTDVLNHPHRGYTMTPAT